MTSEQAIHDARAAAELKSTVLWTLSGFLIPLIAVLVAVARKPSVDAMALAKHDDKDTETIFCAEYVAVLKQRQTHAALAGAACWILILFVLAVIAAG